MDEYDKKEIRRNIRELRSRQAQEDRHAKSAAICGKILSLDIFSGENIRNKKVGSYFPFNGEADLSTILEYLIRSGVRCYFPITYPDEIFMEIYDPALCEDEQTTTGAFGVREPLRRSSGIELLDIILVPGVAYDLSGNRIGFGKGYYDDYLFKNYTGKTVMKIAPAFEFQIVDNVASEPHDIPVDIIVTEKRIIHTKS